MWSASQLSATRTEREENISSDHAKEGYVHFTLKPQVVQKLANDDTRRMDE